MQIVFVNAIRIIFILNCGQIFGIQRKSKIISKFVQIVLRQVAKSKYIINRRVGQVYQSCIAIDRIEIALADKPLLFIKSKIVKSFKLLATTKNFLTDQVFTIQD